MVSPVFITDAIHLTDEVWKIFGDIEVLQEGWKWILEPGVPPSTPISESSPYKQSPYALIFSKDYGWFWIITLVPILDVEIKEGGKIGRAHV